MGTLTVIYGRPFCDHASFASAFFFFFHYNSDLRDYPYPLVISANVASVLLHNAGLILEALYPFSGAKSPPPKKSYGRLMTASHSHTARCTKNL